MHAAGHPLDRRLVVAGGGRAGALAGRRARARGGRGAAGRACASWSRCRGCSDTPSPSGLLELDPRYGQVICACEQVTAAEIAAAYGTARAAALAGGAAQADAGDGRPLPGRALPGRRARSCTRCTRALRPGGSRSSEPGATLGVSAVSGRGRRRRDHRASRAPRRCGDARRRRPDPGGRRRERLGRRRTRPAGSRGCGARHAARRDRDPLGRRRAVGGRARTASRGSRPRRW